MISTSRNQLQREREETRDMVTSESKAIQDSMDITVKDIFQCNECGKWFDLPHSLERHKQSHLLQDKYSSTKCDKAFFYELALKKHMRKHIQPTRCDMCDKMFSSVDYIEEHKETHHATIEAVEQTLWKEVRGREKRKQGCATMRRSIFVLQRKT